MSSSIQNLYIARLTTQDRPCFVCSKFTNVVLTSADNSNNDWFYVCKRHLSDHNFCSKLGGRPTRSDTEKKKDKYAHKQPESDSVVELVSTIGNAWKSWRTKKTDDTKKDEEEKKDSKEEKKDTKEEKKEEKKEEEEEKVEGRHSAVDQPVRFVIQRDYFYLRQREFTKKKQKKEATERMKTLQFPEVPTKLPTLN
ncbi:VPS4-associated protein 1 [Pilobolus umbonatus]|nr:VPS4-associated protein 1 [Pilobolus umbonatus]